MYGRLVGQVLNCGSANFRIDTNATRLQELVSILLTAQATGKTVEVFETGNCSGQFTMINGARVLNQ